MGHDRAAQQADARVRVEHVLGRARRRRPPHRIDQQGGGVGPGLEERQGGDLPAPPRHVLVERAGIARPHDGDVSRDTHAGRVAVDHHHALPGRHADPQRDLVGATEAALGHQLVQPRMGDQAAADRDQVVAVTAAQSGPARLVDAEAQRGARRRRGEDLGGERRVVQMGDAAQGVGDDGALEARLGRGLGVLPLTPAASQGDGGARGIDTSSRRVEHRHDPAAGKVLALLGQLHQHALAGQRALDEYDVPG